MMLEMIKIYLGHVGVWGAIIIMSTIIKSKLWSIKLTDLVLMSVMFSIFTFLAHLFLFM